MIYIFFVIAVGLLITGHFIRMLRWKQFIKIYEKPDPAHLLNSLTIGYAVNFFVPIRAGDVVRVIFSGRKLKNGVPFSLATLILEHFIDIPVVFIVFLFVLPFQTNYIENLRPVFLYGFLTIIIAILCVNIIFFSRYIKAIIKSICSIFNRRIKYNLMFFFYGLVTMFRDVFLQISKIKLFLYTVCMWAVYLISYSCLSWTSVSVNNNMDVHFLQIFTMIFSQGGFSLTNPAMILNLFSDHVAVILVVYIATSLIFLSIILTFYKHIKRKQGEFNTETPGDRVQNLLPWVNEQDCLRFLETYFSNARSGNIEKYIVFNRDIRIIQDFSAGSNATTLLCMNETETFFRKYALGKDRNKLYEQLQWLHAHKNFLPLPTILHEQFNDAYCFYDMKYDISAVGLFYYIHSYPIESSWRILELALEHLRGDLHTMNVRPKNQKLIEQYIKEKVHDNIKKIESAKELQSLFKYDKLIINGESYNNWEYLKKWLNVQFLTQIFAYDTYTDIHGDFTVENLICIEAHNDCPFYFIDPNTGNLHDSPALDYAKLLQSLHGGYEFLMRTTKVQARRNEIRYMASTSKQYANIYSNYHKYLERNFTPIQIRSIYFHEVIHWLRLLPYKIENDSTHVILFFAGLIRVFSDVVEWYGSNFPEKIRGV